MRNSYKYFQDQEMVDIVQMQEKFGFLVNNHPHQLEKNVIQPRADFIQEELNELNDAITRNDFPGMIDALVDIVVVAKGTAAMMGIRWGSHWHEVMQSNMAKEIGHNPKRPEMGEDLIKPPGWTPPNHRRVMNEHG